MKTFLSQSFLEVQCDPDPLLQENMDILKELKEVKRQFQEYKWNVEKIKDNDEKTRFYTGLPTFAVFFKLFKYVN
jgi:hypothetical protein